MFYLFLYKLLPKDIADKKKIEMGFLAKTST